MKKMLLLCLVVYGLAGTGSLQAQVSNLTALFGRSWKMDACYADSVRIDLESEMTSLRFVFNANGQFSVVQTNSGARLRPGAGNWVFDPATRQLTLHMSDGTEDEHLEVIYLDSSFFVFLMRETDPVSGQVSVCEFRLKPV